MKTVKHILIIIVTAAISGNLFCQVCQMDPDHLLIPDACIIDKILSERKDVPEMKYTESGAGSKNIEYVHENTMDIENWMIDANSWSVNKTCTVNENLFIEDIEPGINLEEWMLNASTFQKMN
ncbi:MAG: hypothetical protein JSV22_07810 [Bacteroidales bacterium]|nr:MAG: hypothetical protein JSV22_07810 [Bacteroidales bacterium]